LRTDGLVTEIWEIRQRSVAQEDDNYRFQNFLTERVEWSDWKLDEVVYKISEKIAAQIDCTACANCCHTIPPSLMKEDISRLAERLELTTKEFEKRHTIINSSGDREMASLPCPFLKEKMCSVYTDRPEDCRDYPHLNVSRVRTRMHSIIANAAICPIVFNTLEELKQRLNW